MKWIIRVQCQDFHFSLPKNVCLESEKLLGDPVHISLPFSDLFFNMRSVLWRVEIIANIYIWLCCNTELCHVKNKKKTFCDQFYRGN